MSSNEVITFFINCKTYQVQNGELPHDYTLLQFIREKALLTGTKLSCGEGGCAICTVTVSTNDQDPGRPVASCLVPVYMCHGWNITTVEGLGSEKISYHPIQKTLADNNGSQCGFCSPGMVMTMHGALQQDKSLSKDKIEQTLAGNMCRCTGYRAIVDSMQKVLDIEDIAKCTEKCADCKCSAGMPSQVLATTSEDGSTWYRPSTIEQLRELIQQHSGTDIKIVAGNTGSGYIKPSKQVKQYIDLNGITELEGIKEVDGSVEIGARVSLARLIKFFKELSSHNSGYSYLMEAVKHLNLIANIQIRSLGTWAGNLMLKHKQPEFPSDVLLILECIAAQLNVYDCKNGVLQQMTVARLLEEDMNDKYVQSMTLKPKPHFSLASYKVMPKHQNALTMLSLAFGVELDSQQTITGKPCIVLAGVNEHLLHVDDVENFLTDKSLNDESAIENCMMKIENLDFKELPHLPSIAVRKALAKNLLRKAVLKLTAKEDKSKQLGGALLERLGTAKGKVTFDTVPSEYPMTQPTPNLHSVKQTAGEAQYVGDLPAMVGQLEAVFVTATIGSGEISSIDTSEAEKMPGVVRVLLAADIPGMNVLYPHCTGDEPILATQTISYFGQPLGIIVAETQSQAFAARERVKVQYVNIKKPIVTIKDAIEANSFFKIDNPSINDVISGDAEGAMKMCDTVVSGSLEVGEQYPMHMETQNALVSIQEGYVVVYPSSQSLKEVRNCISRALGISSSMIEARVRRLGGGFGGKLARSVIPPTGAAIAAFCTQKPVKMAMTLEDNMAMFGRRCPFRIEYQIGATKDMKIQSLVATLYENLGFQCGESISCMVAKHMDGAYYMPNWDIRVKMCKTNHPVHCFIRGPGAASATHFVEQIMDHLAFEMKVSGQELREANMYKEGQTTPYKQIMEPCQIEKLYGQLKSDCNYDERLKAVEEFNKTSQYRKKGLVLLPFKYGQVYFPGVEYLVHVMINDNDGSVTIVHGGVEIGQGINTKTIQIAAKTLGLPMDMIKVQPSSTVFNLHSAYTGASTTSDMNCFAVQKACEQLLEKLKPYREKESDWRTAVANASNEYLDLHAKHHVRTPDFYIGGPHPGFDFCIFGATCTEVELDCLTGQYVIRRVDLLYDAGKSLSPGIDAGQIQGAFVMGMGLYLYEEIKYDPNTGKNITDSTWDYHVPMIGDIPFEFNVEMVKGSFNKAFPLGSKTVGEPALLMAECVVLALKDAINSYRKANGLTEFLPVNAPLTVEKILMACQGN